MRDRAETFAAYADECDRRAKALADSHLKRLFQDLAVQWRQLASTVRLLESDERDREAFFRSGPHPTPAPSDHPDP